MNEFKVFIDKIVKHKKWGTSVVKTVTDESVSVYFESTETDAKTIKKRNGQ